jgi:aldehyde:ferredoxin oxidoreductase
MRDLDVEVANPEDHVLRTLACRRVGRGAAEPGLTDAPRYPPAVALEPRLIIELPRGGAVESQLERAGLEAIASGEVAVEAGPTDEEGNLEAAAAGQVVLSVPSPEALQRQAEDVAHVIRQAGTGAEPLVISVGAAEELREEEISTLLEAAGHARRPVILRIERDA